jgi:hypothetical protein
MHYSIQQEFARARHEDLLQEATRARLAKLAREERDGVPRFGRFHALLELVQRQRAHVARRPIPAT